MDAVEATAAYEAWLGSRIPLVGPHVDIKHSLMAEAPFPFLQGTFYLWAIRWAERGADLADAPRVVGVGDIHIQNFGTWRDAEGRLAWGVNDFDEATVVPYTSDLVRLATSAILARQQGGVTIGPAKTGRAILAGYTDGIGTDPLPFVLAETHTSLRAMATGAARNPVRFWTRVDESPAATDVPADVRDILVSTLPGPVLDYRLLARVAGVGSLGRRRVTAVAVWRGARVAREAKMMVPSAWDWAATLGAAGPGSGGDDLPAARFEELLMSPRRDTDPWVSVHGDWLVRRLAPDCSRVMLDDLPSQRDEAHLLECMGRELANVHLGSPGAAEAVGLDLAGRPEGWLVDACRRMSESVRSDWKRWRREDRRHPREGLVTSVGLQREGP